MSRGFFFGTIIKFFILKDSNPMIEKIIGKQSSEMQRDFKNNS